MKTLKLRYTIPLFLMLITAMLGFKKSPATTPYKCMIQMKNYTGEGAYVIISLLNPKGAYEATLYVQQMMNGIMTLQNGGGFMEKNAAI